MVIGLLIVSKSISNKILHPEMHFCLIGIFFYFTEPSDETRQRLIYNDMMQRLIPRPSRRSLRMQGSRILGTLKISFKCIRFRIIMIHLDVDCFEISSNSFNSRCRLLRFLGLPAPRPRRSRLI